MIELNNQQRKKCQILTVNKYIKYQIFKLNKSTKLGIKMNPPSIQKSLTYVLDKL